MKSKLLESIIKSAAQNYYEGKTTMSDNEFDRLVEQLRKQNPQSELLKTVGWGFDPNKIKNVKVHHDYGIVGSLDKIHFPKEIPWTEYTITAKLDGSTCVAYYVNGKLVLALTRGNGEIGIDRTEKYQKIVESYNLTIPTDFTGAIRGEIVFTNAGWERYKLKYPDAKLPRNVSTGLFMGDDITDDLKYVSYIPYKVHGCTERYSESFKEYSDVLNFLEFCHFPKIPRHKILVSENATDEVIQALFSNLFAGWSQTLPLDGLVLNHGIKRHSNGFIEYTDIAFKFQAEEKETEVINVEWNLSKNNIMIPVIITKPVFLSGAEVSRCTGFNYKFILENKIDSGATIKMMRSGEVIPSCTEVIKPADKLTIPTKCPICGAELAVDGVHLRCINADCPNIKTAQMKEWLQVIGVRDILGVGPVLLDDICKAYEEHGIINAEDLYNNDLYFIHFTPANQIKYNEILNNLRQPATIAQIIVASNIQGLSKIQAEKIGEIVYDHIMNPTVLAEELHKINGIGDFVVNAILNARSRLSRLFGLVPILRAPKGQKNGSQSQITVTGALSVPRKQFEQQCAAKGIRVSDNLTNSKYLVTNNPDPSSSKAVKAKKLNIPMITEEEFWKIVNAE